MTAEEAALGVAVVGLAGTLAANALAARTRRRDGVIQELRARTADAFRQAFVIQHAIEWVTWHARFEPGLLDASMKREYAAEVHGALPQLLGSMAAVAALSLDIYRRMQPILEELYQAEGEVALEMRFVASGEGDGEAALARLSELFNEAQHLYRLLPERLAEVMKTAGRRPDESA
jgi:hypothetical protein